MIHLVRDESWTRRLRPIVFVLGAGLLGPTVGCLGEVGGEGDDEAGDLPGVDEPQTDDTMSYSAASATVGGTARVVNTGGLGLRLRSGPGTGHAILTVMPEGAEVKVIGGPSSGWYHATTSSKTGWCYGAYLVPSSSSSGSNTPGLGGGGSSTASNHALLPWKSGKSFHVTQGHWSSFSHTGMSGWAWDFGLPKGTPLLAVRAGKVRRVRGSSTVGGCSTSYAASANYVVVDHHDGTEALYVHLTSTAVSAGASVSRGQLLGHSGSTGYSCGAHLHFQFQKSPSGGGTTSYFNQSIHGYFYDTGHAYDPKAGTYVTSKNSTKSSLSTDSDDDDGTAMGPATDTGFPASTSDAWDAAMQEAAAEP
jgi:murein DD-endopeptidase MepM/ murein hydrolase activator NlpD